MSELEERLARAGVALRVERAGASGEIALLRAADEDVTDVLSDLRNRIVRECRAAGFKYVALELD